MKKIYAFDPAPVRFFNRTWSLVILFAAFIFLQSYTLNYAHNVGVSPWKEGGEQISVPLVAIGSSPNIEDKRIETHAKSGSGGKQMPLQQQVNTSGEYLEEALPCDPISLLPCNQLSVSLPYFLQFSGTEGGLTDGAGAGTGFTMAVPHSAARLSADAPVAYPRVNGYEPSKLTINPAGTGSLQIRTNKGIAYSTNNNQVNTLGVNFDAREKFTLETVLVNPFNGTQAQQGGLWFGLSDKTFVKVVVSGNKVEMRRELGDITNATDKTVNNPDQRITNQISGLDKQTVRLRLVVDPVMNTAEGFYSVDGVAYLNIGSLYPVSAISIAAMGLTVENAYGGIFTTHRNATASVTYTFTSFSLTPANQPPVVANGIADQAATVGQAFAFAVPAGTFSDTDGDELTLTATLADGSLLPGWLAFDGNAFSGTPPSAETISIKVLASDGQKEVSDVFTLSIVSPLNNAPVVVAPPADQTLTAGISFSFSAGEFSDPDEGTVLGYTARLSDGAALPGWLLFNPTTLLFSGTAPTEAGSQAVKVTATDQENASVSSTFTITIREPERVVACSPISTLPCEDVGVALPYVLIFNGAEGGLTDKSGLPLGFTMVDRPSVPLNPPTLPEVPGYEPALLTLDPSGTGKLTITTTEGIAYRTNGTTSTTTDKTNSQVNALGVGLATVDQDIEIETTLLQPSAGTNKSEQAGLWFGLDEDNFVKLVVVSAAGGKSNIEMRREINAISAGGTPSPDQKLSATSFNLTSSVVKLRLVVKRGATAGTDGTVEAFYVINGGTAVSIGTLPIPAAFTNGKVIGGESLSFAGIFATHRRATTPVTFHFEDFSVTPFGAPAPPALTFVPSALDFTVLQGGEVAGQSAVLSANQGNPTVTLSKSAEASWLTLPPAALGTLAFDGTNISSSLAPGMYHATVTAAAEGYAPATLQVNLTVTAPVVGQEIRVNFQDPHTTPPTGWARDYGQPFGLRTGANQGTGLAYGWRKRADGTLLDLSVGGTTPGNGRNRNTPADVLLATLMHMQANVLASTFDGTREEGYWEINVPNGIYDVTVLAGDGAVSQDTEIHHLNVEGVTALSGFIPSGSAGTMSRFRSATVQVTVADEHLTINADGGTNTKINSAVIVPVSTGPYFFWSATSQSLVIETDNSLTDQTFSLELSKAGGQEQVQAVLNAAYGSGAAGWLSFNETHNSSEPNVTFDYTAAKNLPEGTYTATVTASADGYYSASVFIQVTVVLPGSTRPYVISSSPAGGAANVSINLASVAANNLFVPTVPGFKGGVDNSTLSASTVKLLKISGTSSSELSGVVQGTGGGDAISFSPSFALEPNTSYKFVVTDGVKSHSGAAFLPYEAVFTTGSVSTDPGLSTNVAFNKETIASTVGKSYTSVTFGPDGKFYALRLDGVIERFTVNRENGQLSNLQEIKTVFNKYGPRSAVGLTFDPSSTAGNLIAWVSHCSSGLTAAPEFDGNLSRLQGASLENEQLMLTKLPRSKKDHLVNSLAFGPDGALYFNQGSNSSMGAYDGTWQREESLLSATVLRLDLLKLANHPLPLDVRTTSNQSLINNAPSNAVLMSDGTYNPYAENSPLTIFASGVRNAYDLIWHTNGQLYVPANGSAAGGNTPAAVIGTRRPDGTFYSGPSISITNSVQVQKDWLFRVNRFKPVGYFGHPNPLRGEYVANRGYPDNSKYPSTLGPDANYRGAAFDFELNKSPNGAIEYKSNNFGGSLKGKLLVCRFSGGSDIIVLEPGLMVEDEGISRSGDDQIYDIVRSQTGSGTNGIQGLSGFTNPLDLTEDVETGNLYVIEYNWNNAAGKTAQITLLRAVTPSEPVGVATVSPAKIVDNDVAGGTAGKSHTITVANTGNSNLNVTGIQLTGADVDQFQVASAPFASPTSPLTIAPGSAVTFTVAFNPSSFGVKTAKLTVNSDDNPVREVALHGLGTTGLGGTNEPSLQAVLDVHGVQVNVGDDNPGTNIIHSSNFKAALLGEEVALQQFERAVDGPVTIEPLAVFGPQHPDDIVTAFGWYASGDANTRNELFSVGNSHYQTVNVSTNGSLSFDPGSAFFGFYSRWPYFNNRHLYSEDALNTFTDAIPHHVRVYPLKNADGTFVENAYVVATEEHISGFDFQDIVVVVRNVRPAGSLVRKLEFSEQSLSFSLQPGVPVPAQSVTLSAANGTPAAVSLSKSEGSNWLVLPQQPALGALSFGIIETSLAPGTYQATVTAAADGFVSATIQINLLVNEAVPYAGISVDNDELIFDGVKGTTIEGRLTISNTGTSVLDISSITISGANANKFSYEVVAQEGVVSESSIDPDNSKVLRVVFTPGSEVNAFEAALNINSNAINAPSISVGLYGLSTNGLEGSNEPTLAHVVKTLGYGVNVGWTTLTSNTNPELMGEEVLVQVFEKAEPGMVSIVPVARYSPKEVLPFGFYTKSSNVPGHVKVGELSGAGNEHQTLFPQLVMGTNEFDPEEQAFGLYVYSMSFGRYNYTEDGLNTGGVARRVRTYPMKDRQGQLIPNSYLVCFEDAANGDYQDYMFVLSNVIPVGSRKELAFDQTSLNFNAAEGGTVPAKSVALTARNGTPGTVTIVKSENSNWLVVPDSGIGEVSIGVNVAGLTPGVYSATVSAAAEGYTSASLEVNLSVSGLSAAATKINFQLSTSATPAGYLADVGLAFDGTRGYGWVNPITKAPKDHTLSMRDRTTSSAEVRLRTLAQMQSTANGQTPGSWEFKVEPGFYNVSVSAGDPNFFDSEHTILVEGVTAISRFLPTSQQSFRAATVTVEVTDGNLTISAGGTNTKVNYVIVDPASTENDFIPPVASVKLKGIVQSPGVYKDQVVVSVEASDTGGSGLASIHYSVNNGPFAEYFSPLLINTAGTYSIRAKAIDGNLNEFTTSPAAFTVVTPTPSNANMVVENQDKFPAMDRLTFSRIQTPWRRQNDDGTYTPYNRNHDVVKLRISNKGSGVLTVNDLTLSYPDGWRITQLNGVDFDAATALPLTVNPRSFVDATIAFVATDQASRVKILNDTLYITSNDDKVPYKKVILHGLFQNKGEGSNEPHAQEIIRAFGFKTKTGFNANDGSNGGNSIVLNSDEILSSFFVRADASKPVYAIQMGAYHGCCSSTETFQWYEKGTTTNRTVFTHNGLDGQSLLPRKNGSATALAEGTFTPIVSTANQAGAFGFKVSSAYSDRNRNSEGKIGLRFWKAVDPNGKVIPNAYIIGHDYIGNPTVTNYDYQDNVFYVSNVRPEIGTAYFSELAAAPSAVDFGSTQTATTQTFSLDLKNLGLTYADGSSDPAIKITGVEIVGPNLNEFSVSAPAALSLAPQGSSSITLTFRPNSQGLKNAALLVYYDNALSPLRVPLYGIADEGCNAIAVVKRIKSAADAMVEINGKQWEADISYRKGLVQLDKPAPTPIAGTDEDVLYQTYLSSTKDLELIRYEIPLPNGKYMVRMHFVENFWTAVGARVFNISLEGQTRLTNLDIFREVGFKAALVKDFEVTLTDGQLDLLFNPTANRLAIAGLEIFQSAVSTNAIALVAESITGADCGVSNGSIKLAVSGAPASSYLFKLGADGVYQASPEFGNLPSGQHTFYVKENVTGGCVSMAEFTIPDLNNNLAFTVTTEPVACDALTGTATVSNITGGSGSYTVTWGTDPVQTGRTANLQPGTYVVTVTDAATDCKKTQQVTMTRSTDCQVTAIRINSGSTTAFTTTDGRVFSADQYFNNTFTYSKLSLGDILNTEDDFMYKSERGSNTNLGSFTYNVPVPNGSYKVRLHFAEIYSPNIGRRVMNVTMEGSTILSNYDIVADVGYLTATIKEFDVNVTDGFVTLVFSATADRPKLSALEVLSAPPAPLALQTTTSGISTLDQKPEFKMYPNPNSGDRVFMELSQFDSQEEVSITMIDALGREVYSTKVVADGSGAVNTELVFREKVAHGLYHLRVQAPSGHLTKRLVVK